jgi:hypothetical protein
VKPSVYLCAMSISCAEPLPSLRSSKSWRATCVWYPRRRRAPACTVSAPVFLMNELAGHLANHRPGVVGSNIDPDSLIFLGPRGRLLRRRFGERILKPAAERAGLPSSLTFHGLRHIAHYHCRSRRRRSNRRRAPRPRPGNHDARSLCPRSAGAGPRSSGAIGCNPDARLIRPSQVLDPDRTDERWAVRFH